jgi:hypothetical protein
LWLCLFKMFDGSGFLLSLVFLFLFVRYGNYRFLFFLLFQQSSLVGRVSFGFALGHPDPDPFLFPTKKQNLLHHLRRFTVLYYLSAHRHRALDSVHRHR